MKKLTFWKCYAIVALVIIIVYGWLCLKENRYISVGGAGAMFDTWKSEYKPATHFMDISDWQEQQ